VRLPVCKHVGIEESGFPGRSLSPREIATEAQEHENERYDEYADPDQRGEA
jgi:hypothetical protein